MDNSKGKDQSNVPEESLQEISYADGALEIEAPGDGATIENPPNGGLRAWLIVLSCLGINTLQSIMVLLIRAALVIDDGDHSVMYKDTGIESETLEQISDQLLNLSDMYAPFAALVMIFLGYAPTVCIGAGVVMATLFFLSYLGDDDTEDFIKFLIYGPTAVGIGFIRLGVLIPVLEYFTTKRLRALLVLRLGLYFGEIILIGILFIPNLTFKWRHCLRASSALCIGIGLIGLTLKDLKLKMTDDQSVTFIQKTLGLAKKDILRNILLWITCVVYLFYQWGIEPAQTLLTDSAMVERIEIDGNTAKALLFAFSRPIGMAIGMFSAWMFKKAALKEDSRFYNEKLKNNRWNFIFVILMINAFTMGIACFIAPHAVNFGYFFPYSLVYGAFFEFCEGTRDDIIPEEFGRDNVRFVAGLIGMSAGIGGVITTEISVDIEGNKSDGWKNVFYYGGGMLVFSAVVIALVLFLKENKALDKITSKLNSNTVFPLQAANHNQQAVIRGGEQQSNVQTSTNTKSNSLHRRIGHAGQDKQLTHEAYGNNDQGKSNIPYHTQQSAQPVTMYDL